MHGVVSHLARRGVEMGTSMHKEYQNFEYQMPVYGIMIIVSTAILYLVGMTLVRSSDTDPYNPAKEATIS